MISSESFSSVAIATLHYLSVRIYMSDLYLYHDEYLYHRGFFEATTDLRLGDYRGSPRILGYSSHEGGPRRLR